MSFVQREIDRLNGALDDGVGNPRYPEIYAAQQALAWALDPLVIQSPYAFIAGSEAAAGDCSAESRPPPSSDTCAHARVA